ncbi:hypothetical protein S40293_11122 [Stachybotrys chartarum IBT 40293]|nr:hypothetical protein S40293_11122 [Stachybotrys chartarum IBT 40293]
MASSANNQISSQEWELRKETIQKLYSRSRSQYETVGGKEQTACVIGCVQAKLQSKYGLKLSVLQIEKKLGSWGFLESDELDSPRTSAPSPAQASLHDDPEWIMISTLSKLGISKAKNIFYPGSLQVGWNSLPSGQLEEHLRSVGIDPPRQGSALDGSNRELIAAVLGSKSQTTAQQKATFQYRFSILTGFFPTENVALITGDQIFEMDFNRYFRVGIEAKDGAVVKLLVDRKLVNVNDIVCQFKHKQTPLERAAELGALDIIRCLTPLVHNVNKSFHTGPDCNGDLISLLIKSPCLEYWSGRSTLVAVTASPELMETIDVLLEAGADVSVGYVKDPFKAFTTSDVACRLSSFIKPSEHGRFFKDALEKIAIHSEDDDSATQIVKNVMAAWVVSAPCQCLAADSQSTDAVAPAARRRYVKFVKLLNPLVNPSSEDDNYQERVLAAAISSGNKELIDYLLSFGPDLDPPALYADRIINRLVRTTPLAEALRSGDKELVKIFEEAGDFRRLSEGNRFQPVLRVAIETGDLVFLQSLLARAKT